MACNHVFRPHCGCAIEEVPSPAPVESTPKEREPAPEPPKRVGIFRPKKPEPKKLPKNAVPWNPKWKKQIEEAEREKEFGTLADQLVALAMTEEGRKTLLQQIDAELARTSFAEFCRQAWHVVEPSTKLEWSWHHEMICNVLQALFESWLRAGTDKKYVPPVLNTVFSVAPGSLKSRLVNVMFPAWCWLRAPGAKFICLSVNEDATMRDARAARDLIRSKWYVETFKPDWKLKGDQDAISNYGNDKGGERLSKPSGSAIVGLRGDFLIYDDPNSPDENQAERELINSVWDSAIYSRVNSGLRSMRIGIQQRVGGGDWTDHVLKKQGHWSPENPGGWLNVVLPAEFELSRRFALPEPLAAIVREKLGDQAITADPRKVEGEIIHPQRFSPEYLANERKRFEGTGNYASQYQQKVQMLGGNLVKSRYWSFFRLDGGVRPEFDEVPKGRPRPAGCVTGEATLIKAKSLGPGQWDFDWVCLSIDCAVKKTTTGSNWGMIAVAGKDARRYVLDDRTRRGSILEIIEVLRDMIKMWRPDKILIEDKAAGEDLKLRLLGEMQKGDMPMVILEPVKTGNAGKEERLMSALPTIANSMVHLLDGAVWLEEFVSEHAEFPAGLRDDRVDCLSQCLNHYYQPIVEDCGLPDW